MLFCSAEGCHLGAGGCAAKHRYERDDEQFAKIILRVLGVGIGDVFKGAVFGSFLSQMLFKASRVRANATEETNFNSNPAFQSQYAREQW